MDRDAPNLVHVGRQQGRPALLGLFVGGCLSMALVNLDHAIFRAFPSYLFRTIGTLFENAHVFGRKIPMHGSQ
jgi:hypothetical protein